MTGSIRANAIAEAAQAQLQQLCGERAAVLILEQDLNRKHESAAVENNVLNVLVQGAFHLVKCQNDNWNNYANRAATEILTRYLCVNATT